jgi:aerobic carbon-monoxide dehydrogenase medium subunit
MKIPPFEYHAPASLDEALELLAEYGDEGKILAGGQSLLPLLAMRLARPGHVIDLNRVDGLDSIAVREGALALGPMVRERSAERSPAVQAGVPVLAEALRFVGHEAIRNRGTVAGSLAHADASSELPAVAVVTEADMLLRSKTTERRIPASQFFQGHFTTALADDECLVEVRIPVAPPRTGWCCEEVARRHGDFALVGAIVMTRVDDGGEITEARIAMFGVADQARRAPQAEMGLVGTRPSSDVFRAAAAAATSGLDPPSDIHGSADYRRHLAAVVVRRALTRAAERAGAA